MLSKLTHILLAVLLLIGSTGLVVNKHYCQRQLKSTALFLKAKNCHQNQKQSACTLHAGMNNPAEHADPRGCCDDKTEYLQADEDQIVTAFGLDLQLPVTTLPVLLRLPEKTCPHIDRQNPHYLNYKPPLIVCDRQVTLQTFLC